MDVTGKCKAEFENWFKGSVYYLTHSIWDFEGLEPSMQYGVYVDFFDSVGIYVDIDSYRWNIEQTVFEWVIQDNNTNPNVYYETEQSCKTRHEARIKAIEKANEIINEQLNK